MKTDNKKTTNNNKAEKPFSADVYLKPPLGGLGVLGQRLFSARTRFVINYGGTGSGKSYAAAQKEVLMAMEIPGLRTLVIRKVGSTLRDSVIPNFRNRISDLSLGDHFTYNKTDRVLTNKEQDSQILFRGLDDPEKLKSFEGLTRILVEEASELELEDFLELNRRVRGKQGIQITLCFNPIHEQHWLKKHFFDQELPDLTTIHSTYKDNPHLTDKDREQIEWMQHYNYNQYRIYALGEWGLSENRSPWLFAFNKERHVRDDIAFLPSYPVYLSFDFNREPVTCIAAQMSPHRGAKDSFVNIIQEFSMAAQLHELCAQVKAAYPASILYVTGDASGRQGNIGFDTRHATYYRMIQSYLNISERQLNLNPRNLEHHDSRLLVNTLLHQYPAIHISAKGCPGLINDCTIATVEESSSKPGMLKKDRSAYKMDLFDAMRYFFQTHFSDYVPVAGKLPLKQ